MGMFSWDCHCCGRSLRNAWGGKHDPEQWRAEVVVVAQDGTLRQGRYNGYGAIGRWKMPQAWGRDDAHQWVFEAEHSEQRAHELRETVASFAEMPASENPAVDRALHLLRESLAHYEESAATARALAAKCIEATVVFTAYHRRCWEHAGRPGFQGQSKCSEDQGS